MAVSRFVFGFLLVAVWLIPAKSSAQDYHWHCTLSMPTYCVAFNPLSRGRVLFTSTPESQYIYRSDDGGEHWSPSAPLDVPAPDVHQIFCLPSDTNIVLALTGQRFHAQPALYRSTNGGATWTATPDLGGIDGEAIAYYPATDELYYGENFAGIVYKSIDHGKSWLQVGKQNSSVTLCSLSVSPDASKVLVAGSEQGVIDRSTDEGATWSVVYPADTVQSPEVPKVIFSNVAPNVAFAARWHSNSESLVVTHDHGATWTNIASPDPHVWALEIDQRRASCPNGRPMHLWTGLFTQYAPDTTRGGMIEETTDGGTSWHTTGFPKVALPPSVWVIKYDSASGAIAAATDSGVFIGHEPTREIPQFKSSQPELRFYPNPATNSTTLLLPYEPSTGASLQLFNIIGRMVTEQRLTRGNTIVDVGALSPGVYFARIIGRDEARVLKVAVLPR